MATNNTTYTNFTGLSLGQVVTSQWTTAVNASAVQTRQPVEGQVEGVIQPSLFIYDIVPLALTANNLVTSTTPVAAGYLTLAAGTGVTRQVINGTAYYVFDVPRTFSITQTAGAGALTPTVSVFGLDVHNVPLQEDADTIGTAGGVTNGKKAFKAISAAYIDGATGTAITVGTGDTFGLPYRIDSANYLVSLNWNGIQEYITDNGDADSPLHIAGTFSVADTTNPATSTDGDVRGTYLPSSAADGTKRLTILYYVKGGMPMETSEVTTARYGVPQYLGSQP